jgi:hypothetical protein
MIGTVKRSLWLLLMPIVAMSLICCASSSSAGATKSRSQLCTALKPAVQAGQKVPSIVTGTSSQTLAKSKSELLAAVNVLLKNAGAVRVQLRSAPPNVRTAFNWDVSADGRFRMAVKNATTPSQIKLAARDLVSSPTRTALFIAYVLSRCEDPTPAP